MKRSPSPVGLIEGRHVDTLDLGQPSEHGGAITLRTFGLPPVNHVGDLSDDFLSVAQNEGIDELGERLGVVGAVTRRP